MMVFMKKGALLCVLSALATFPTILCAAIEVQDLNGRKMSVDVLSYTASSGNVRIKRLPDGTMFNVKLNLFDPASQKKIIEVAPKAKPRLLARVSAGKRRERLGDSSYMKKQTITATATIENDSRDIDFVGGKGTILLVARQTERYANRDADYGKILQKETFTATINPGKVFKFECKPVVTEYDSDRDSSNIGGWEYYGWVLVMQDKDGDIVAVETSIGNLKKEVEQDPVIGRLFLELSEGKIVEKNLSKKGNR